MFVKEIATYVIKNGYQNLFKVNKSYLIAMLKRRIYIYLTVI